jgi:ribonucleoside-diphosphate reductase alpha chain
MADDNNAGSSASLEGLSVEELRSRVLTLEGELTSLRAIAEDMKVHEMPGTHRAITHKFDIQGREGYITVGLFDGDTPGELFITMAKEGSTITGLLDAVGTLTTLLFRYRVPMEVIVKKMINDRYEPIGLTQNPDIKIAKSITDYLYRWLAFQFIPDYGKEEAAVVPQGQLPLEIVPGFREVILRREPPPEIVLNDRSPGQVECPPCDTCGKTTVEDASVWRCLNCGNRMARDSAL